LLTVLALVAPEIRSEEAAALPSDLKLIRERGTTFVTVSVADVLTHKHFKNFPPLMREELDRILPEVERRTGINAVGVERVTMVFPDMRNAPITVVRTRKPYDVDTITTAYAPRAAADKVGGFRFFSAPNRPVAVALVDDITFVVAEAQRLTKFLTTPAVKAAVFPDQVAQMMTGRHLIVAGVNADTVRDALTPEVQLLLPPGSPRTDAASRKSRRPIDLSMLHFKPFLRAQWFAAGLDLDGPDLKIDIRCFYPTDSDARDGEFALGTLLYVVREGLIDWMSLVNAMTRAESPNQFRLAEQWGPATRAAEVGRRGSIVQTRVSLEVDWKLISGVYNEVADQAAGLDSKTHLRQIGFGFSMFMREKGCLPPAAICDAKGKPLLSWRVALLPYVDQEKLYKEFNLDEPWDGPNNIKLLRRMPEIYIVRADDPSVARHETYYRCFIGESAVFEPYAPQTAGKLEGRVPWKLGKNSRSLISVVEAGSAVPWTKPEEVEYDPNKPVPKLGGLFRTVFHAVSLDGAVFGLPVGVDDKTLRPLIAVEGGK
jgi:hypothetical protein